MSLDKETKIILTVALVSVLVFAAVSFWAIMRLESRSDWCDERDGIMLKSSKGWLCVDAKVLK